VDAFELARLREERARSGDLYLEFLRVPDLSAGLYVLAAGAKDPQTPHQEDEVYAVLSGRAMIRVGEEDRRIEAGSIVYVPARVEHRFHSIDEELELLVFFARAESG
jgi:mannose-6-phosphate isomerase-like protein (cupin superfamily)